MGCAEYQERIIDLALGPEGTAPDPKLAHHLVVCADCSEELQRRRALLARIDSGVAVLVSADVPRSLAARVRQQIAIEDAKGPSTFAAYRRLWLAGAGAAIATAAILLAFSMRSTNRTTAPKESVARNSSPVQPPARPAPGRTAQPARAQERPRSAAWGANAEAEAPAEHLAASRKAQPAPQPDAMAAELAAIEATPPTLEVLIPANEHLAIRQLLNDSRDGLDEKVLAEAGAKPIDPIDLKPLKIDSIAAPETQPSDPGSGFD